MGAVSSKEAVHENMVAAVLLGQIAKDDYLARAHKALTELEVGEPPSFAAQPWMEFYNVHLMLVPGPQPLEHGMVRLSDGTWYIAVKTDLGTAINGDMFDWWFRHCTGDERFKWLHPRDHKSGDWNPQFYAVQPEDRPRGYYVHHSHKTSEYIGGRTISFQMEYDRPSKFFNVAKFAEAGVTAVVCGRLHILETLGLAGIAHVVHMVRVVNGRSELRTRIYLGDFNKVRLAVGVLSPCFPRLVIVVVVLLLRCRSTTTPSCRCGASIPLATPNSPASPRTRGRWPWACGGTPWKKCTA